MALGFHVGKGGRRMDRAITDDLAELEKNADVRFGSAQIFVVSPRQYSGDYNTKYVMGFKDGAQTYAPYQPELDLWIPLRFWFNLRIEHCLWSHLLTTMQKTIVIQLTALENMIQAIDQNGVETAPLQRLPIVTAELYMRNIYVGDVVRDLLVGRRALNLIRVHRSQVADLNRDADTIALKQLKYPIEALYFGFRPQRTADLLDHWYRFTTVTTHERPIPAVVVNPLAVPVHQLVIRTANYDVQSSPVGKVGFRIFGNDLYLPLADSFFRHYLPYVSPGVICGEDGNFLLPFSLRPGPEDIEVAGHINTSETREFYLRYSEANIGPDRPAKLYVTAKCINFLYFAGDGSMILKYIN